MGFKNVLRSDQILFVICSSLFLCERHQVLSVLHTACANVFMLVLVERHSLLTTTYIPVARLMVFSSESFFLERLSIGSKQLTLYFSILRCRLALLVSRAPQIESPPLVTVCSWEVILEIGRVRSRQQWPDPVQKLNIEPCPLQQASRIIVCALVHRCLRALHPRRQQHPSRVCSDFGFCLETNPESSSTVGVNS